MHMETGDEVRRRCRSVRRWSGKLCALAAILGTIAASAVATAVTVVLRPVRLSFSITDAMSWHVAPGATWAFNVTVANPSRRAGVYYLLLSVSMEYLTPNGSSWVLESGAPTPCYQPPWNTTSFPMAFCITKEDNLSELGRVNTSVPMNPYVKARVRFKVGPAYTKPYEITVLCNHVYFANNESSSASSHSHQRVHVHPPVNCTGTSP
ncbi:uncharacterized protein [Miscanthus floridulus]|uniref:uncharacterized protein n=1 Tax=Miscanthus floridulus TaxID=154761 RepID=UPI003458B922